MALTRTCDVDEKHGAARTVAYGVGSELFVADLCAADEEKVTKALEPFMAVGTPISVKDLAKIVQTNSGSDPAVVRQWLNDHGRPQSDRGRISADDVAYWRKETGQQSS
jgi:Lsr2